MVQLALVLLQSAFDHVNWSSSAFFVLFVFVQFACEIYFWVGFNIGGNILVNLLIVEDV